MNELTYKSYGNFTFAGIDVSAQNDFDFISPEYRDLFDNADATAFQHPNWLASFYRQLAPNRGAKMLVVLGRNPATGALIFVLPLIRRKFRGISLIESADLGVSDYAAPVIRNDMLEFLQSSPGLRESISSAIGRFDLLRIKPICDEMCRFWLVFFKAAPQPLDFSSHASAMTAPYEAWRLEAFGKSHTKYIDRKARRFEKAAALALEIVPDHQLDEAIHFVQEQRQGRFAGDPIQQDFVRIFYAEVAQCNGPNGLSRTYQLMADGERVGVVFGLTHKRRYYYLLIGCNYENYGRHSPGLIMYDRIMADWLNDGGEVFDFTIGDEPFKGKFAAKPTQMFGILEAGSPLGWFAKMASELRSRIIKN